MHGEKTVDIPAISFRDVCLFTYFFQNPLALDSTDKWPDPEAARKNQQYDRGQAPPGDKHQTLNLQYLTP